jgi:hypothetical protein
MALVNLYYFRMQWLNGKVSGDGESLQHSCAFAHDMLAGRAPQQRSATSIQRTVIGASFLPCTSESKPCRVPPTPTPLTCVL